MRSINRLNEEIARWSFEIKFKTNASWNIAFTNPTAGPWKTIKAYSLVTGKEGEVYRFALEEDRPDIIMYNDSLKTVIIIEAKDSLNKLIERNQANKSAAVVVKLANVLKNKFDNEFWRGRENYKIVLGLLWGSTDNLETEENKEYLYDYYYNLICSEKEVFTNIIVGIETLYRSNKLACEAYYKCYDKSINNFGSLLVESLNK